MNKTKKRAIKSWRDIGPLYRPKKGDVWWALIGLSIVVLTWWRLPYLDKIRQDTVCRNLTRLAIESQKTGRIDPQAYWEFRDRSSNGGLKPSFNSYINRQILELTSLPIYPANLDQFTSRFIEADDYVVNQASAGAIIKDIYQQQVGPVSLAEVANGSISRVKPGYLILAQFSADELIETNGLSDYSQAERQLLVDQVWISRALIKINPEGRKCLGTTTR